MRKFLFVGFGCGLAGVLGLVALDAFDPVIGVIAVILTVALGAGVSKLLALFENATSARREVMASLVMLATAVVVLPWAIMLIDRTFGVGNPEESRAALALFATILSVGGLFYFGAGLSSAPEDG